MTMVLDPTDITDVDVGIDESLRDWIARAFEPVPWHADAACRGEGVDPFFGFAAERPETRRIREWDAEQRFCSHCSVHDECRDHARRHAEFGYWGSENEHDRAALGIGNNALPGTAQKIYYDRRVVQ